MNMIEVTNSGNIKEAGYDEAEQAMRIRFASGKIYEYEEVPQEDWDKFAATFNVDGESPGKHFAASIRNNFTGKPVEG